MYSRAMEPDKTPTTGFALKKLGSTQPLTVLWNPWNKEEVLSHIQHRLWTSQHQ